VRIALLPGDGVGPEVAAAARRALAELVPEVEVGEHLFGGAAIIAAGTPLPDETLAACRDADAILLGAVGLPQFDSADVRPEQGILRLRRELEVYANLRPSIGNGVDLMVVRELIGGLYFGPRGTRDDGTVFDTLEYHPREVERIAHRGFEIARTRKNRVTSVDKANVIDTSRMWRRVVTEVAAGYPDVELEHVLVDAAAMFLVQDPGRFDLILTENMFGDILSDEAAGLSGGLGLAASASLGDNRPGIFEPVHGSAPDIAGRGIVNPTAMLRSAAMLLEHGLDLPEPARALERAVDTALASSPTLDLGGTATTDDFVTAVLAELT
jgi:3-isopropylmalate dehydrogenase